MIDRVKQLVAALDQWSRARRWPRVLRRAVAGFIRHEGPQYAGSMAYFGVLSMFQVLVLAVVAASLLFGQGEAREWIVDQVEAGTPLDRETIAGVIDAVIDARGGITIVGFVLLLWSGLGAFSALSNGVSRAFESAPRRGFVQDKLVGLLLMGVTGLLAIGSVVIGLVTGTIQQLAAEVLERVPGGGAVLGLIGFVVPILLIMVAFWIIYRVVPNRPVTWQEVLPGALVATLLWTLLRFGFTYYATNIARYDSAFGPISTAVTLLVFLYFASMIVLIGAEVARANAVDDELAPQTDADPRLLPVPTGPPPPPAPLPAPRRRLPAWLAVAGGAVAGLLIGRWTKRDEE